MTNVSEEFVRNYLRLNGYFCIENFIVHAGDDEDRITQEGLVGNYTETDILGIRLSYSNEISGKLYVANDPILIDGINERKDIIIGEAKTGNEDKPNRAWKDDTKIHIQEYILNFIGIAKEEKEIREIAKKLANQYIYEDHETRIRYIIFSEKANKHYLNKGVSYITDDHIINFLIVVRGQSWMGANIGVASLHQQWPPLLKQIFEIANNYSIDLEDRKAEMRKILDC
jgi:hypothetical protein